GLATLATTNGQGSAEQPVVVRQLGESGTEVPFGRREASAVHGVDSLSEILILSQSRKGNKPPSRMRICVSSIRMHERCAVEACARQSEGWMRNHWRLACFRRSSPG